MMSLRRPRRRLGANVTASLHRLPRCFKSGNTASGSLRDRRRCDVARQPRHACQGLGKERCFPGPAFHAAIRHGRRLCCFTLLRACKVELLRYKDKGKCLNSAVFSPWDHLKRLTPQPLAGLYIPTPSHILWEPLSHAAITARRVLTNLCPSKYIARYSFLQLCELK